MAREAAMSKQQLAVYRQKYEEASACNRRLQQQLCAAAKRKMGEKTDEQINVCSFFNFYVDYVLNCT